MYHLSSHVRLKISNAMLPGLPRTAEQRTANGCWTCRLRKLKCDEGEGECHQCRRHDISCAGYGPKPDWKDGGAKEAEKLELVKDMVSRKRKNGIRRSQSIILEHRPATTTTSLASMDSTETVTMDHDSELPPANGQLYHPSSDVPVQKTPPSQELATLASLKHPAQQASIRDDELLMHYLDYVFQLQFRHHKYAVNFSSRGWLFSLIKRITPLRHSVLSLSALHQHCLTQHGPGTNQDDTLRELRNHHSLSLSGLRQFLQDRINDPWTEDHVPTLACCIQLISFDVFGPPHIHLFSARADTIQ